MASSRASSLRRDITGRRHLGDGIGGTTATAASDTAVRLPQ
jgi:hypothetical protein